MPRKNLHAVIYEAVSRGLADAAKDSDDVYLEEPITRAVEVAVKPFLAPASLGHRGGKAKWKGKTKAERSAEMSRIASLPRVAERCPCGRMTAARAKARGHRCGDAAG